jgi:hypothetical protein
VPPKKQKQNKTKPKKPILITGKHMKNSLALAVSKVLQVKANEPS